MPEKKDKSQWWDQKEIIKNKIDNIWVFKEKEKKELEDRIVETLKGLNWKLTRKEIVELFQRVEVSKWLDWLKKELEKEKTLWWKEISDELLKSILDLIKESKEITQKWIEELKIELGKLNESKVYEIDKQVYLSNRFPWIKKLENSELGKNIVIDIAGIIVGIGDSAVSVFKFLLGLVMDFVKLPFDVYKHIKK